MREFYLPGHPENTPENVGTWAALQRATWNELLKGTPEYQQAQIAEHGDAAIRMFVLRGDSYVVRRLSGPVSFLSVERHASVQLTSQLLAGVGYWTDRPPLERFPLLEASHIDLGNHTGTRAVEIGRLEQIRFQQGLDAYQRALKHLKS